MGDGKVNKKQFLCMATSLAALAVAAPVSAEQTVASGFFVTIGLGQSNADLGSVAGLTVDDTDTSYSIGVGYKISEMFSVEAGYQKLGEASASGTITGTLYGKSITATGINLSDEVDGYYFGPVVTFPVSENFEVQGRLGVYSWEGDIKGSFTSLTYGGTTYSGTSLSTSHDGSDAYYGLGVAYKFSKNVSLGADWTRFDIDDIDTDVFGARLKYSF